MKQCVSHPLTFIEIAFYFITIPFSRSEFGWKDYWAVAIKEVSLFFEGRK